MKAAVQEYFERGSYLKSDGHVPMSLCNDLNGPLIKKSEVVVYHNKSSEVPLQR